MRYLGTALLLVIFTRSSGVGAQAAADPSTLTQAAPVAAPVTVPAPASAPAADPAAGPIAATVPTPAVPAPPAPALGSPPLPLPVPVRTTLPPEHSFVHLGASYPRAQLELKSSVDQSEWRAACLAPCDRVLPVGGQLARVTAPGMTTSNVFRVEPGIGTAFVRVDGGSAQLRSLGLLGLGVGIPAALAGMGLFGYGKYSDNDAMRVSGAVVLATGAVVLVASLPLLLMGGTKVRDGNGAVIARTLATGRTAF
jgi:hypothetical protein